MNNKRIYLFATLVLGLLPPLYAYGQSQAYYVHKDHKITLQQTDDVIASRILTNAVVAKVRRDFESKFEVVEAAGIARDELIISREGVSPEVAAASISHIEKIKEAHRLRVFQPEGGDTYLIEFPEIIVQYAPGTPPEEAEKHIRLYSKRFQQTDIPGRYLVQLETAASTIQVANEMNGRTKTSPIVEYAHPNFRIITPAAPDSGGPCPPTAKEAGNDFPNDPLFPDQWGLRNMPGTNGKPAGDVRILGAWAVTRGKPNIQVAILDEGLDLGHPDLNGKIIASWDAVMRQDGAQAQDDAYHGTACAGIIAALSDNNLGIAGVAPEVKLIGIRVAIRDSQGRWVTDPATVAAGIDKAVKLGADVLSNSWGVNPAVPLEDIERAIQRAYTKGRNGRGSIIIQAAGNTPLREGTTQTEGGRVDFPANMAKSTPVIAIGAVSPCEELKTRTSCDNETFWASNHGPEELSLLAPGVRIITLTNRALASTPYTTCFRGTSSATPFVAGVAALLLSIHSELTADEVKQHLIQTADVLGPEAKGYRRINACRAVGGAQCDGFQPVEDH
jgi:thermitase